MRYGRSVPAGSLQVYSADSEEEARALLTLACETNLDGEFVARELAEEQTMEHLSAFSHRLHQIAQMIEARKAGGAS